MVILESIQKTTREGKWNMKKSTRKSTNKFQNDMVKTTVIKLYEINAKFKQIEQAYKDEKKQLQQSILGYMDSNGFSSFHFTAQHGVFSQNNKELKIVGITPKKVGFDIEKMEEIFSGEVLKTVINKQYHIVDMAGLVAYLKSCGVDPKKFKSFIDVEKTVNQEEINRLGEIGEIKREDLAKCCNIVEGDSYVRIQVVD